MKIPKPTELNPRLAELNSKRNSLHVEKASKVAETAAIRARLQISPSNGTASENRVREILGQAPLPDTPPDMERLERLLRELDDLNRAISILDAEVEKQRAIASKLVCEAVRPEVDKRGREFASALVALHAKQHSYHSLLEEIQDTGTGIGSLPNVFVGGLGSTRDSSSAYAYGMKDFMEAGYMSRSDMPKALA